MTARIAPTFAANRAGVGYRKATPGMVAPLTPDTITAAADVNTNADAGTDGGPTVGEADFQTAVIDLAHVHGWMVAHFRAANTPTGWRTPVAADGKGFPDLVLVHPKRGVLFRELKSDTGRLTSEQRIWLQMLRAAGADAYVWRPCDWPTIMQRLDT